MYLHSIRHYFRILKRTARSFGKTALLSSLIIITLGVNVTPLFAQTPLTPAEFATKYNDYIKLFNGSSLTQTGLVKNQQTNKITGFVFNLNLKFPVTSTKNASWHWDHVSTSGSDSQSHTFLIRVCNTASSERYCWINTLPFNTGSRATDEANDLNNQGINVGSTPEEKNATVYEEASSGEKAVSQGIAIRAFQSIGDIYNYQASINEMSAGSLEFVKGNSYIADAWYCANNTNGSSAETAASEYADNGNFKDALVKRFGPTATDSLCGDKSYFRIATSASFTIPADDATINQQVAAGTNSLNNTADVIADPTTNDGLPECSMTNGAFGAGSFMGCIARLVYYVVYWPVAWFAGLMGSLFDFFLMYSLSDASYRADFAVRGWQLVRDISNIFFIIILVWTGLSAVFGTKNNMKSVVPNLILNALLINFSLFATRVVIDVSNVVARVFYNSMQVTEQSSDGTTKIKEGIGGSKPLSEKIVSSFNPQRMFASGILNQQKATDNVDNTVIKQADSDSQVAGYFIIVSIIAAIIMFGIAMMFWKVAFLFLGRVIGLYIAMIFAPFAFLTQGNMPLVSGIKELSWSKWLDDLTNYALLAPIFVFFLYIIYSFLESDFLKVFHKDVTGSFFETVIFIAIPMLIVYFMVKQGAKIAQDYSGSIGKSVQEWGNKIAGFAGGVALGGVGLAGGRLIGGAATSLNKSKAGEWLREKGKSTGMGGWLARRSISGLNATEKTSFDFRKTQVGQTLFKEMGVNADQKALGALAGLGLGFGTSSTAGGYQGQVERYQKKQEAEGKLLESKQDQGEIDAYNEKNKKKYQEKIDTIIDRELEAIHGKAQVDQWKTSDKQRYEQERQVILQNAATQAAINAVDRPVEKKSVQEVNAERKDKFAENLKKGSGIDNTLSSVFPVAGTILGTGTRTAASKKAAKKVSDSAKIEKDLTEINTTLKNGFREIVAMDQLRNDPLWTTSLTAAQRTSLMRGEKIEFVNSTGTTVKGGFYDYVKDKNQTLANAIDIEVTTAENNKDKKKDILDQIKTRQQFKFDFKKLNQDIKNAEDIYANTPSQQNLDSLNQLKSERVRLKNEQKKWQDLDKYIEEQKKKLEGKE